MRLGRGVEFADGVLVGEVAGFEVLDALVLLADELKNLQHLGRLVVLSFEGGNGVLEFRSHGVSFSEGIGLVLRQRSNLKLVPGTCMALVCYRLAPVTGAGDNSMCFSLM